MRPGRCHGGNVAMVMVVGGKSVWTPTHQYRSLHVACCMLPCFARNKEHLASSDAHACMEIYKQVLHYIFVVDTSFSILFNIIQNN